MTKEKEKGGLYRPTEEEDSTIPETGQSQSQNEKIRYYSYLDREIYEALETLTTYREIQRKLKGAPGKKISINSTLQEIIGDYLKKKTVKEELAKARESLESIGS